MTVFTEIFDPYYDILYDYIFHFAMDKYWAEEVTQEVFYDAFKNPTPFLAANSIEAMLKTAAKNKFINMYKKEKKQSRLSRKIAKSLIEEGENLAEEFVINQENYKALLAAVRKLPPDERQIIDLYYFECLSMTDIANILGLKYTTALARRNRTLKDLRKSLIKTNHKDNQGTVLISKHRKDKDTYEKFERMDRNRVTVCENATRGCWRYIRILCRATWQAKKAC